MTVLQKEVLIDPKRARTWRETMFGNIKGLFVQAHKDSEGYIEVSNTLTREVREQMQRTLVPQAQRGFEAGNRRTPENPDPYRTCFEVDRDRILHKGAAFRRLAGKTQVFIFPEDHMRTRLTHALEVEQVARAISTALRLNVPLTEAIALGHDCGHGPFGHASEDALTPYTDFGFDHARFGADVILRDLNLTAETLDGIRSHSWSLPAPKTLEGEVVSWADRVAYVCHDFEDACRAGIVTTRMLPEIVKTRLGIEKGHQLNVLITDIIHTTSQVQKVGMSTDVAEALAEFRQFNYDCIYMRPAATVQNQVVIEMLRSLVEFFIDHPNLDVLVASTSPEPTRTGSTEARDRAVSYVAGMTDRFALRSALKYLDWPESKLPKGVDMGTL